MSEPSTPKARLNALFAELRRAGYVAKQNVTASFLESFLHGTAAEPEHTPFALLPSPGQYDWEGEYQRFPVHLYAGRLSRQGSPNLHSAAVAEAVAAAATNRGLNVDIRAAEFGVLYLHPIPDTVLCTGLTSREADSIIRHWIGAYFTVQEYRREMLATEEHRIWVPRAALVDAQNYLYTWALHNPQGQQYAARTRLQLPRAHRGAHPPQHTALVPS